MTRIIAGTLGGHNLKVPAKGTRPTSERVREALFSKLEHMGVVDDTQVIDLFAGSGALGIEALSRGARHALFVEKASHAARLIQANLSALKLTDRAQVQMADAVTFICSRSGEALSGSYDLVLIDPPYDIAPELLQRLLAGLGPWLSPDALVVVETSSRTPEPIWPDFLVLEHKKKYGETTVWFVGPPLSQMEDEE